MRFRGPGAAGGRETVFCCGPTYECLKLSKGRGVNREGTKIEGHGPPCALNKVVKQ